MPSRSPIVFLLGAPRSGTTLLRVMLAGHPRLFSPPELLLAPFATMAERRAYLAEHAWEEGGLPRALMELSGLDVAAARAEVAALDAAGVPEVYAFLQARLGERLLVDKCPHLSGRPEALARAARWFPDARYLWLVRHPASVTASLQRMPMVRLVIRGYAERAEDVWWVANDNLSRFFDRLPPSRFVRVSFEELVTSPRSVLERVAALLDLPFVEALLDPYAGDRMRDGPPGARAVGDPGFAGRGRVDPSLAWADVDDFDPKTLSAETWALAQKLGYGAGRGG